MSMTDFDAFVVSLCFIAFLLGAAVGAACMRTAKFDDWKAANNCRSAGEVLICAVK